MSYETTTKFVRSHVATITAGSNGCILYWMKLLYEFWGFCVNGTNDLKTPGGFATLGGTLATNYIKMAPGFESGSSVLIASGSDGSTSYGSKTFTAPSIDWTSGTMVGRHIVLWQSGSSSTDDSIYTIKKIIDSSSITVDTTTGGTVMSSSNYELRFSERSNINFRVVDLLAAHSLVGYASNDYMILQFNGNAINVGQANSQAKITLANGNSSLDQGKITLSASGSWNGSSFTDESPSLTPDGQTPGDSGIGFSTYSWTSGINGINSFTLIADQGGIITHYGGSFTPAPSCFHIEIPKRLFPALKDPNPICCMNIGKVGVSSKQFGNTYPENWSSGWMVHEPLDNSTIRRHHAIVRNLSGHNNSGVMFVDGDMGYISSPRYQQAYYNTSTKKFVVQDVILAHRLSLTSYTMGRCQLRLTAFATGPYQKDTKLGQYGQWICADTGILYPWDNAQMPRSLFPFNV